MTATFHAWESFILAGIAAVFGYHIWLGWRTRIVRFPVSVLAVQEFERDQSPENFWGVMALNGLGLVAALFAAGFVAWGALAADAKPIGRLQSLDGCYEGQGSPDFMRPPFHWTFRVANGVIFDRAGKGVSNIRLLGTKDRMTVVSFSPGILIADDEHKASNVYAGDTVAGNAYESGNRTKIALADDWGNLMQTTSCG
jgi:hypothetical protein